MDKRIIILLKAVFWLSLAPVAGIFLGEEFLDQYYNIPAWCWGMLIGLGIDWPIFRLVKFAILAPNNLFYTFVGQNRAKIVKYGQAFKKCLLYMPGYELAKKPQKRGNVLVGDIIPTKKKKNKKDIKFYGIWPFYDIHLFKEPEYEEGVRNLTDFLPTKRVSFRVKVKETEDNDLIPLDVELNLEIRIINPEVALFSVKDFWGAFTDRLKTKLRELIGTGSFQDWIRNLEDTARQLSDKLEEEAEVVLHQEYGLRIEHIAVISIDPSKEDHRKALVEKITNKLQAEGVIEKAHGEQERIKITSQAIQKAGLTGELMMTLEAVKDGQGNWVIPSNVLEKFTQALGAQNLNL